ncbi:MAG: helix-turn-helix domain-containing protein [Actinomycetota bacterium]|nr:helix-turn-helix domain-containing protein [Actinomycetota bacterium]
MAQKDDSPRPAKGVPLPGLRELRRRRGLSQREVAEQAGITQGTIWQLETGRRGAYPRTIRRLCKALGVAPEDLICGRGAEQ